MGKTQHFAHCPLSGNPQLLNEQIPDHQGRKLRMKTRKDGEREGRDMAVKSTGSKVGDCVFNYIPLPK